METTVCLKVKNGIIVTIPPTNNRIETGRPKDDTTLALGRDGLVLIYKGHQVSIPEEMFESLRVVFPAACGVKYLCERVYT